MQSANTLEFSAAERDFVFGVAMKYVKDPDAAADITQDAMLAAHRHRDSFRGDCKSTTWLYRVAATSALMYLRTRRRRAAEVLASDRDGESSPLLYASSTMPSPESVVGDRELAALVATALGDLGDKYRAVFWMRYGGGHTESEIAEQLGLSLATVKTRAHRARHVVRDHLVRALAH